MSIKILNSILIILASLLIFSCKNEKGDNTLVQLPQIMVDSEHYSSSGNIDQYISTIEFVPLETNKSSFIKEISKMIIIDDTILIGDFEQEKLFLFNKNDGSFITSFSRVGRGPAEYIHIEDIAYDKQDNKLYVTDMGSGKLLAYKLDGEFINYTDLNVETVGMFFNVFHNAFVHFRHNMAYFGNPDKNIVITNKQQEYINSGIQITEEVKNLSLFGNEFMSQIADQLYVFPCFNDTVFAINADFEISPEYVVMYDKDLDVKKSGLWEDGIDDIVEFHNALRKTNLIFQTSDFYAFSDNILFRYFTKWGYSLVMYSVQEDKTIIFGNPTFTDKNFIYNPVGKTEDQIIASLQPTDYLDNINRYLKTPVDLNSNPVLCFMSFK